MFIELLDILCCPADHPQIPLVAAIIERDGRMVTQGVLGCPTCHREYPVRDGAVWFSEAGTGDQSEGRSGAYGSDGALRAGAFVAARDGSTVALVGGWSRYASELAEMSGARVYAVNPTVGVEDSERVGILYCDRSLPFAAASLQGLAIDEPAWSTGDLELASSALAASGRMAAPASSAMPSAVAELARDDDFWVGEKAGPLVSLYRR